MSRKYFSYFCLAFLFLIPLFFYSCSDDDDNVTSSTTSNTLDGTWQLTMSPLNDYIDTVTIKGKNGADFVSLPSTNDQIYLFESNGEIRGYTGPYQLRGAVSGDSMNIDIYEPISGLYGQDTSMIKSSEMTLRKDAFGHLSGTGRVTLDWDTVGANKDTYTISGYKISDQDVTASFLHDLCDAVGDALSFITRILTEGILRPMANCWGEKQDGGFYVFGSEGPGNILPIWTQTAYYPMEWSWCKVRRYKFDIKLKESIIEIELLEDLFEGIADFLNKIGYSSVAEMVTDVNDFFQTYGNFAISLAYNTEDGAAALYVNNEIDSGSASTHQLPQKMRDALGPLFSNLYIFAGKDISDEWHMRRSDFFVCNTPLVIVYLFGTAKVEY